MRSISGKSLSRYMCRQMPSVRWSVMGSCHGDCCACSDLGLVTAVAAVARDGAVDQEGLLFFQFLSSGGHSRLADRCRYRGTEPSGREVGRGAQAARVRLVSG